jgi:hypothetical protein
MSLCLTDDRYAGFHDGSVGCGDDFSDGRHARLPSSDLTGGNPSYESPPSSIGICLDCGLGECVCLTDIRDRR